MGDSRFGKFFFGKRAIRQIEFSKCGFKNIVYKCRIYNMTYK